MAHTSKYGKLPGAAPALYPDYLHYSAERAVAPTEGYVALAREYGLDPARMALAYINSRPFLTGYIIRAAILRQLESSLESANSEHPADLLDAIETIHTANPNRSP